MARKEIGEIEEASGELTKRDDYADIHEVKDLGRQNTNELRVYCSQHPNNFRLQIRTFKGIAGMIATIGLSIKDVEKILDYMRNYERTRK